MNDTNFKNLGFIILFLLVLLCVVGIIRFISTQDNSFIFTQINNPDIEDK